MLDFADEATRAVMHLLGFGALCIVLLSRFRLVHNCAHTFHFISFRLIQSRHCCRDRIRPILSRSHIPPLCVTRLLPPVSVHATHTHTHSLSLSLSSPPPLLHPHFPFWDRDPPWITQPKLTLHNSGKQLANTNQVHSLVLVCPDNVVHILTKGICINGNNSNDTMATTTIAAMRWQ